MKTKTALLGVAFVFIVTAYIEQVALPSEDSIYYDISEEESVDAIQLSASTSYEYILEAMNEVDGYIVETYQEYEVHEDEAGNVIVRIPTENYQYMKYYKE